MNEKSKVIGGFAGKFLPPHIGHISQIEQSAKECDKLYIVVADRKSNSRRLCKAANIPYIPVRLRIKWLKKHFKHNPKIKVVYLNEDKIPPAPHGTAKWAKEFKKLTHFKINKKFADESYRHMNEVYFKECEFACFDRTIINISATQIRTDLKNNIDKIIPEARDYFIKIINKQH